MQKRKMTKVRLSIISMMLLLIGDARSEAQSDSVTVWNVINFSASNSFSHKTKFSSLDYNGVETPLEGYKGCEISKGEVEKLSKLFSLKMLEESHGLINERRSETLRKILFGLENYCFQIYEIEKNNHKVVTLAASKLGGFASKEELKSSLIAVDGGGILYFRGVVEYRNNQLVDIRIVLSSEF